MRAFLALDISEQVKEHLISIQDLIKQTNGGRGNYSTENNLHLTLAFLDEITEKQANILVNVLKSRLSDTKAFELKLKNLGFFQTPAQATLYCAVNPDNGLKNLVSVVLSAVKDSRINITPGPFKAHITLGRKVSLSNCRVSDIRIIPLSFPVNHVTLYRSTLTPKGPIYSEYAKISIPNS